MSDDDTPMKRGDDSSMEQAPAASSTTGKAYSRRRPMTEIERLRDTNHDSATKRRDLRRKQLDKSSSVIGDVDGAEVAQAPAVIPNRQRPDKGAMMEPNRGFGIYKFAERIRGKGHLNWRNYGTFPEAEKRTLEVCRYLNGLGEVVVVTREEKVFKWNDLFKDVRGKKIARSGKGFKISEAILDFWDRIKVRFLEKKYGHLCNIFRTWHTRKCIISL